jgi:PAS domain S-box-containing protein
MALIGAVTLAEHLFGLEPRLNQLVSLGLATEPQPGRMAAGTAVSLLLAGLALFNLKAGKRRVRFALHSAMAVLALSWLALTGYAYDVNAVYEGVHVSTMALDTAATLFVLGLSILGAEPTAGLVGIATSDTAGAALARRLVPTIPIVFLLLGWAWLAGAQRGLYDLPFGTSLMVLSATALGVVGLGWHAWLLHRSDLARSRTESDGEVRFAAIVASSEDAIFSKTLDGVIQSWNRGAERMFGYRAEEVIGHSVPELLPDPLLHEEALMLSQVREGKPVEPCETMRKRKDGSVFDVALTVSPIKDARGRVIAVSTIARDITERRIAERKLRASLEEKEILLREIHHRVKNNLAAISSFFYLESAHAKRPETVQLLQEARGRVLSLAMAYEKLYESPHLTGDFGKYLQALLAHLLRTHKQNQRIGLQVNTRGLSLSLDLAVPCATIANELVTNCLKHAFPAGRGGHVWIDLERRGAEYLLRIADDGVGVPAEFEPDRSRTLGLRLVRSLVTQIDGRISFRNANPGLEVLLCFPGGGSEPAC